MSLDFIFRENPVRRTKRFKPPQHSTRAISFLSWPLLTIIIQINRAVHSTFSLLKRPITQSNRRGLPLQTETAVNNVKLLQHIIRITDRQFHLEEIITLPLFGRLLPMAVLILLLLIKLLLF